MRPEVDVTLKKWLLLPNLGENCVILSPFVTDYGCYSQMRDRCKIKKHNFEAAQRAASF